MKNIKNIVLDLGVVLINLNRDACIQAFRELGIDNIAEMTSLAVHKGIFAEFELGNITREQFFDAVKKLTGKEISDRQINDAWLRMLDDIPQYKLDLVLQLKKNYNVFLLSNTNEIHWEHCKENYFCKGGMNLNDYFNKVCLSYEMHKLKPEADIFHELIEICGIDPNESMLIDDAIPNCDTAIKFGFKTYAPVANEDWSCIVTK